jgi:hypothetical protein
LVSVLVLARIGGSPGGVRLMSVQALVVQAAAMSGGIIMGAIAEWLPMQTAQSLLAASQIYKYNYTTDEIDLDQVQSPGNQVQMEPWRW